ncbi:transporter [Afipia sp. TerB]
MEWFLRRAISRAALVAAFCAPSVQALADDKKASLSQQLANPIANLTSVPIQYNALFGAGRGGKGTASVLDIQPVIPFRLNEGWESHHANHPAVNNIFNGMGNVSGLADTQASLFLSPQEAGPGGLIWGVGTAINIPTATDPLLGTRKWGAGPTAVALIQKGSWTVGTLANQMWTFDGSDINKSFIQPWVTYELQQGWSVSITSQTSYDWNTRQWTVPLNAGFAKLVNFGQQPVQIQFGGIYMLTASAGAPRRAGL